MCSLLSIIRHYKGNISKEELSYILKENNNGVNLYNLLNGAKEIGFDGYAVREDFNDFVNNKKTLPVIVHTIIDNMFHYIVVYDINYKKEKILVMDPARGLKKYSFDYFKKIYNDIVLFLFPVKKMPILNEDKPFMNLLLNIIFNVKKLHIFILSFLVIVFTIVNNYYFKIIIDDVLVNKNINYLFIITAFFLILSFIKNIINYIKDNIVIKLSYKISSLINNYTINHILRLPYHYFKIKSTGDIISRLDDLEEINEVITKDISNIVLSIFVVTISLFVLLIINIKLSLIVLVFSSFYILLGVIYSLIFKNKIKDIQEYNSKYNSFLVESIENFESIKNLNIISKMTAAINHKFLTLLRKNISFYNSLIKNNIIKNIIDDYIFIIILFIGSIFVINEKVTLGSLITFSSIVSFYINPLKNIIDSIPNLCFVSGSIKRINDLFKYKEEKYVKTENKIQGDIEVRKLSYTFNNYDYLFKNKIFLIKRNAFVLIDGKSGVGKSTFFKILKKYINEYEGNIKIGNINLQDIDKSILDNSINYVSQNERLYSGTIRENIEIIKKIDNKKYNELIGITYANQIIDKKMNRSNFYIEEGGFNLSGGERQKIVLTRALTRDFEYLIIDEALSEIDTITQIKILKNIREKYKNKTIICVSHNDKVKEIFKERIKF